MKHEQMTTQTKDNRLRNAMPRHPGRHRKLASFRLPTLTVGTKYFYENSKKWRTHFSREMKEIILTQRYKTIVDDVDFERFWDKRWHVQITKGKPYAKSGGVTLHRAILGDPDGHHVDHINGDTLDNRRENIRVCEPKQNARNNGLSRANSSGAKGVYFRARQNNWVSQIYFERKHISLGSFATFEEARDAYDAAAVRLFGEFARTNKMILESKVA